MRDRLTQLAAACTALALVVAVFGAYVRLSDAGLSCPDWPFCYGQITTPDTAQEIEKANAAFPARPVETEKGRKEMMHRYLASTLGLMILILAGLWLRQRRESKLPFVLLAVVIFQGLLGMWTVTMLVHPAVVTAHLLGGMATIALSFAVTLISMRRPRSDPEAAARLRTPALVAVALVIAQIALGGWTSTNYAALSCFDFPTCYPGIWWPKTMDFDAGFTLLSEVGVNYEQGVLAAPARIAIHMVHRIGALIVFLIVGTIAGLALKTSAFRRVGACMAGALLIQVTLGVLTVKLMHPTWSAVAHNGGAALLLLSVVALAVSTGPSSRETA